MLSNCLVWVYSFPNDEVDSLLLFIGLELFLS
jgi:hypothetical protein